MVRRIFCIFVISVFLAHTPAAAQTTFKQGNPDVGKYAFARSYINSLSYINKIQLRLHKTNPKKLYTGNDIKIMRGYVATLIKDDIDLRVARNLLEKYLDAPNALIRKTTDTFIAACQTHMAINARERQIWDQWFAVKSNKLDSRKNETAFLNAQEQLALKRKEANKQLIEATVMVTKVLKSSQRNKDEKGRALDLTTKERDALLSLLDTYGKNVLAWGLKPGQDHMQASIAVLREVLEDSAYTTLDD